MKHIIIKILAAITAATALVVSGKETTEEMRHVPQKIKGHITCAGSDFLNKPEYIWIKETLDKDQFVETESEDFDMYDLSEIEWFPHRFKDGTYGIRIEYKLKNVDDKYYKAYLASRFYYGTLFDVNYADSYYVQ